MNETEKQLLAHAKDLKEKQREAARLTNQSLTTEQRSEAAKRGWKNKKLYEKLS